MMQIIIIHGELKIKKVYYIKFQKIRIINKIKITKKAGEINNRIPGEIIIKLNRILGEIIINNRILGEIIINNRIPGEIIIKLFNKILGEIIIKRNNRIPGEIIIKRNNRN